MARPPRLSLVLLTLCLAGCGTDETGTNKDLSPREACLARCERGADICLDQTASDRQRDTLSPGPLSQVLGVEARCAEELKACRARC